MCLRTTVLEMVSEKVTLKVTNQVHIFTQGTFALIEFCMKLFGIYICKYFLLIYEPIEKQKRSFLCELLNRAKGHNFDTTLITARGYGLTVALL